MLQWMLVVLAALAVTSTNQITLAASYYFSGGGNDALGDGSLASPWKSIAKFNTLDLNPGDNALFRAGDVFTGKMFLDAADSGASATGQFIAPVRIGSYGATGSVSRARIVSPINSEAFQAYNNGGIELSDLEFASGGMSGSTRVNGVQFLSDKSVSASLNSYQHIRIKNVASHGFGLNGLQVWAHVNVGYNDVQVTGSEFYDNGYSGVYVGGTQWHGQYHTNVVVDDVVARNNPGFASTSLPYTGHGILVAQTNGGVIQNSVANDNGQVHGNGNFGFFTYGSNNVVIQGNLAYGNRSPGGYDGGGFDIDGGATNSIVQYNHSYDNDGAGMLLAQFDGSDPMANNVFRYNLSVNDGRDGYGGITVWGFNATQLAKSAVFHNNTVVVDRNVAPNSKGVVMFFGPNHTDIDLINNALVALNGATLIAGDTTTAKSSIVGNAYWTAGGKIVLEDATYATVQAWSNASQQERVSGQFVGVTANPQFVDSQSYRLYGFSPLADKGRMNGSAYWPGWLTTLGGRDLGGLQLYQGVGPEIGAWEILPGDFNVNGIVDAADFTVWRDSLGSTTNLRADANLNGVVDQADYNIWKANYAMLAQYVTSPGATYTVPEPSTILLLVSLLLTAFPRVRSSREWLTSS